MKIIFGLLILISSLESYAFREICLPINRGYINRSYEGNLTYDLYSELINKKKVYFPKGTKVKTILETAEDYLYEPIDRWSKHLIYKNGLSSNSLKKGMTIVYPFCQQDFLPINFKKKKIVIKKEPKQKKEIKRSFWDKSDFKVSLIASSGTDEINSRDFSYMVIRPGLSYTYDINKNYRLGANLMSSHFLNAEFDDLEGEVVSTIAFEPWFSLEKKMNNLSLFLDYRNLTSFKEGNSAVLTEEVDLIKTNYLGLRFGYSLMNQSLKMSFGLGILKNDIEDGQGGILQFNYSLFRGFSLGLDTLYKSFSESKDKSLQMGVHLIYDL